MANKFSWDKAFKPIVAMSILIASLSVAHYFIIFLPAQERQRLEVIKQDQEAKSVQESGRVISLEYCIQEADAFYLQTWNQLCAGLKREEKCNLPDKETNRAMEIYSLKKDECFYKYGSK